ncbi:hypothetical protein G3545_02465 [Starkeya sp. ORNL1]|uniref:hypothetical protein n=1 Tax=Starkeya sp. ORNL1 TaxID=2709380 RepID=UPI001464393C|nr:hypothetical protein [Starkeya sp. ORNL1]QJP12626.1 hypothetical protein G3545_02465 [Starkeya sp. ORNL1]
MNSRSIIRAVFAGAIGASLLAAPAVAYEQKPKWGDSEYRKDAYRHEKVRKQQVRQTRHTGPFKPIFHPLTSAWNKVVR